MFLGFTFYGFLYGDYYCFPFVLGCFYVVGSGGYIGLYFPVFRDREGVSSYLSYYVVGVRYRGLVWFYGFFFSWMIFYG